MRPMYLLSSLSSSYPSTHRKVPEPEECLLPPAQDVVDGQWPPEDELEPKADEKEKE